MENRLSHSLFKVYFLLFLFQFSPPPSHSQTWANRPILSGQSHKGFYPTGELRFVCTDGRTTREGETTSAVSVFRFKRTLYDRCGNARLVVKGRIRLGCWEKKVEISKYQQIQVAQLCPLGAFEYPDEAALVEEMLKEL